MYWMYTVDRLSLLSPRDPETSATDPQIRILIKTPHIRNTTTRVGNKKTHPKNPKKPSKKTH
jgi:hypothetical protein